MLATFEDVAKEMEDFLKTFGGSKEVKRKELVERLTLTLLETEFVLSDIIMCSPMYAIEFVQDVIMTLEVVNRVLSDFDIDPVHIGELNSPTVGALEALMEKNIDSIAKRGHLH